MAPELIRDACIHCGRVSEYAPTNVAVHVCTNQERIDYRFWCSGCAHQSIRATSREIARVLIHVGVPVVTWALPAELLEPRSGPPLTADDVLEFALALRDCNDPARVAT